MFAAVFNTMFQVIVPISIPVIAGALLRRFTQLDVKPLLTLYLYFLSPAIIFDTLSKASISSGDIYQTLGFCLLNLLLLWACAQLLSRALKLPQPETAGLTLMSTFTNSVNYGLPLVLLAFGQAGLDHASVYVITQMVIVNTVGIILPRAPTFPSAMRWCPSSACPPSMPPLWLSCSGPQACICLKGWIRESPWWLALILR